MGLDMTLYHEADKDIWMDEELDSSRCPYFRNERELHNLIARNGVVKSEGVFELTKESLCNILITLLPSIMNVYAAAMDAHNEMSLIEENELTNEALHREFYVIGKLLSKSIRKEYKEYNESAVSILNEDEDGVRMKKFVNDLIGLIKRIKDEEKVIYNASY